MMSFVRLIAAVAIFLASLLAADCFDRAPGTIDVDGPAAVFRRELVTREMAIYVAEQLIKNRFGEGALEAQSPLELAETSENWVITGKERNARVREARPQLEIIIAKFDCKILRFNPPHAAEAKP